MLQIGGPPKQILIPCDVCAEEKPIKEYVYLDPKNDRFMEWNLPVPPGCLQHLAPQLQHWKRGVCIACLHAHVETQLQTRGALNISCVHAHDSSRQGSAEDWLPYSQFFLSPKSHAQFGQESIRSFTQSTNAAIWACPAGCGYGDGILLPADTAGYPKVECPGCNGLFCASCVVPWHVNQTCQLYRTLHPGVRDQEEEDRLQQLTELGARRCPRCQFAIVKEGGCHIVECAHCTISFLWVEAEQVVSPTESRTAAQAVGVGGADREEEDIYLYDHSTGVWVREACEMDDIRGRQAGKRYVRKPSCDRLAFTTADDSGESFLLAFTHSDNGKGARSLAEALDAELDRLGPQSANTPWNVDEDPLVRAILEGRA
jgi:hypothetical protein